MTWQPSATIAVLKARAQFFQKVRAFFDRKDFYEVDPPLLSAGVATDPLLAHFDVICPHSGKRRFLQTSPEFAMKRLLAAGSGPIYYLGKAFRQGEAGTRHNPEFTLLEWYRPGWDHHQLMNEVDHFVAEILGTPPATVITYAALFEAHIGLDPHVATKISLQEKAVANDLVSDNALPALDKDGWLDLIMSCLIEPAMDKTCPTIVTEFPVSQASLAKTVAVPDKGYSVAERFEYYCGGMELANGYHELLCAKEQEARFKSDIVNRAEKQLPEVPIDTALIAALAQGLPACAGVALGIDRLFMLQQKLRHIAEVLPFEWARA